MGAETAFEVPSGNWTWVQLDTEPGSRDTNETNAMMGDIPLIQRDRIVAALREDSQERLTSLGSRRRRAAQSKAFEVQPRVPRTYTGNQVQHEQATPRHRFEES